MLTNEFILNRNFRNLDETLLKAKDGTSSLRFENRSSRNIKNSEWFGGTKDFEEAFELASSGWSEGLKEIKERVKKHRRIFDDFLPRQDFASEVAFSTEGEAVDVARAIEGIPESMIKYEPSESSIIKPGNKMQRIIVNISVHCEISQEAVFNRGALLINLIDALELHGFRTELVVVEPTAKTSSKIYGRDVNFRVLQQNIVIKQFTESPDFSKFAFVFAHVAMLRRIIFSLMEQEEDAILREFHIGNNYGSYGYPCDVEEKYLSSDNIYFGYLQENYNFATLLDIIVKKVKKHFNIITLSE